MANLSARKLFSLDDRRRAVQKLRKAYGLTQADLARAARISQATLSLFENGVQDVSEAAFARVHEALIHATVAQKVEVAEARRMVPLFSLLHGRWPQSEKDAAHYFNIKPAEGRGFTVEYQGPGMPVCEDYSFRDGRELEEFIGKCLHFKETVWTSEIPDEVEDD